MILTDEQKKAYEDAIEKEENKNSKQKTLDSSICNEVLENKNEELDEFDINECLELKGISNKLNLFWK